MQKLDPKVVWIFFFQFFGMGLIVFIFAGIYIGGSLAKIAGIGGFWGWLLFVFILYIVFCYIWAKLTYRFWGYQLTEDAVKIEKGVIWKKYISIPYERIQNIDIYRGILARILGLSDLQIQTAGLSAVNYGRRGIGGAGAEGRLPGLDKTKADELREEFVKRAKGAKQGL